MPRVGLRLRGVTNGLRSTERADAVFVRRAPNDSIEIGDDQHSFGYPPDVVLGDDPRTVLEQNVEWLIDELCETKAASGEQSLVCQNSGRLA